MTSFFSLLWFAPYVILNLAGWALGLSPWALRTPYCLLHVLLILYFGFLLVRWWRTETAEGKWFWILLGFLLWLPGSYLEFPSDPWEHLLRISQWSSTDSMASGSVRDRFAYYWMWTVFSWFQPVHKRAVADLFGAFWQLIVCLQIYSLAVRLGFSSTWARVQTLAFVLLFGTNLFSFRYYALSSTPLAFASYLAALGIFIAAFSGDRGGLKWTPWLVLLMALNHRQELLLLAFSAFSLGLWHWVPRPIPWKRFWVALFLLGFAGGWAFMSLYPYNLRVFDRSYMTRFGSIDIWRTRLAYFETMGGPGWLAVLLSLVYWRRLPQIAVLTLAPVLVFVWPVFAIPLAFLSPDAYAGYRLLYSFPASFMLVGAARARGTAPWIAALAVALLALPPERPWRGRLLFQFYVPPLERALRPLDETVQWLYEHRSPSFKCSYITDDSLAMSIGALLGLAQKTNRLGTPMYSERGLSASELAATVHEEKSCGVLAAVPWGFPALPPSWAAKQSGHWSQDAIGMNRRGAAYFYQAAEGLVPMGWNRTLVPPFYVLYEPAPGLDAIPSAH